VILYGRHLEHVLRVCVDHHTRARPHRAIDLRPQNRETEGARPLCGEIRRRDRLGGVIDEYYRAAA
jgi:putative transposase